MSTDDLQTVATLDAAIMNIPVSEKVRAELDGAPKGFYLLGHRDARHAAAELASSALSRIEALERERDAALRSRDDWIRENGPGGWIDALRNLAKERAIRNETLMRALEIIAVGDSKDPVADAKDALVEAGCWGKEQTT